MVPAVEATAWYFSYETKPVTKFQFTKHYNVNKLLIIKLSTS